MRDVLRLLPILLLAAALPARGTSLFGREFWLAWPQTPDATAEDPSYDLDAEVVVLAADRAVSVRVTAPGVNQTVSASPGAPARVRLPRASVMVTTTTPAAQAIHVAPATPACGLFAVLLRAPAGTPSIADDMVRVPPADVAGRRYLPVGYWGAAEFVVVATQDGTTVDVTGASCAWGGPYTLDRGQVVQHRCVNAPGDADVTGAIVQASAPVVVISGSERSNVIDREIPGTGSRAFWGWADLLLEAPWPVDLLGREHAHAPFRKGRPEAKGDLIRLVAACDATTVDVTEDTGVRTWLLERAGDHADVSAGDWELGTYSLVPGPVSITSDKPMLVASYTVGTANAGIGDPSLSMLDPIDRWERTAVAWLPPGYAHSISVVTDSAAVSSVRLDGGAWPGTWGVVPGTTLRWSRIDDVADGEHRVTGAAPLFAEVSGFTPGEAGAYSLPAVPLREDASGPLGGLRLDGADACATACPGACTTLSAPPGFASYAWSSGETTREASACPDVTEAFSVIATDAGGCRFEGSVTIDVEGTPSTPSIDGPATCCAGGCIDLTASAGYASYSWTTGETTARITACPLADTTYRVAVTATDACPGAATKTVTVYPPPVPGAATVTHPDPCLRGLEVAWDPPTWRPGSPGGVVNVYRREGGCAPVDDPAWVLVATGLTASPWRDVTTQVGRAYAYLIEAEDAVAPGPCAPGPAHAGPTGRRCAEPPGGAIDPGDPDAARLVSVSPHLRALGYERASPGGTASAATFWWPGLASIDPATHLEAWRGTSPQFLSRVEPLITTPSWRDSRAADAMLLFYKVFNATDCGTVGE